MKISEVLSRMRFIKTLYEREIIKMLSQRNIPEAKKDIEALRIGIAIIEERSSKSAGSEEIYTK
jgi:hypothetical protein